MRCTVPGGALYSAQFSACDRAVDARRFHTSGAMPHGSYPSHRSGCITPSEKLLSLSLRVYT